MKKIETVLTITSAIVRGATKRGEDNSREPIKDDDGNQRLELVLSLDNDTKVYQLAEAWINGLNGSGYPVDYVAIKAEMLAKLRTSPRFVKKIYAFSGAQCSCTAYKIEESELVDNKFEAKVSDTQTLSFTGYGIHYRALSFVNPRLDEMLEMQSMGFVKEGYVTAQPVRTSHDPFAEDSPQVTPAAAVKTDPVKDESGGFLDAAKKEDGEEKKEIIDETTGLPIVEGDK